MQQIWDSLIKPSEKQIYKQAGLGAEVPFGRKAAIIVVDAQYGFTGEDAERPLEESIQTHPMCCGPHSWDAVGEIARLLPLFRERGWPVCYTHMEGEPPGTGLNQNVGVKGSLYDVPTLQKGELGTRIVEPIAPAVGDMVISKKKPSAFFGTPLAAYLIGQGVDTVVVTGGTTSGCIRATVIDAFSYNFQVLVAQEAVFDRGETMHAMNLFDMQQKYAEVVRVSDVARRIGSQG